jgi:hypothetical protein
VTVLVVAAVGIIAGVVNDDGADEYMVGAVGPRAEIVAAGANDLGRPPEVTIEVEDQPDAGALARRSATSVLTPHSSATRSSA